MVLWHTQGRFAGLWQIVGTEGELRRGLHGVRTLPTFIGPVQFPGPPGLQPAGR